MFEAIRAVKEHGQTRQELVVNDANGKRIVNSREAAEFVKAHFVSLFSDTQDPL